jgi:hypothetical protein
MVPRDRIGAWGGADDWESQRLWLANPSRLAPPIE